MQDTALSQQVSAYLVQLLFNDLAHPAASSISPRHEFRSADGSGNNIAHPTQGAARQPYARSVQTKAPRLQQPDPGLVFDLLLRRKEFKPHPSGLSSLLFAQANLIIHDCFNTDRAHGGINANSSYLDLQIIYGNSHEAQMRVRTKHQGFLYPDTFGDRRLAIMTPSTTAMAIMYSRNHNFIAKRIYEVNERGTYKDPSKLSENEKKHQDEDIFQRARLVNCGFFANVILSDYIPAILNQMGNTEWFLNPLEDLRDPSGARIARATGNQCSAEFSFLYRWHSAISRSDEHWLNGMFHTMFPGRDPASIDPKEFAQGSTKYAMSIGEQPKDWTPHGWQRGADGRFEDAVLAKVLMDATQEVAGAFQARGHPAAMRIIDSLGLQQSRSWALASLNECECDA
jgi:Animal haem peroxidase